jgi:hypothetical protein
MAANEIGEILERKERPAYVRFETIVKEDKAASVTAGHFVGRDVHLALITPPYSKDIMKYEVPKWIETMKQDVQQGRLPRKWMEDYIQSYDRWKKGLEIPLNGTPIRGWGVISPSQQETLIRQNVLTVEDLALINDEGMRRLGIGAVELRNKAKAWVSQLKSKGPLTQENAALKTERDVLAKQVETLTGQVQALLAAARVQGMTPHMQPVADQIAAPITASDLMDERI